MVGNSATRLACEFQKPNGAVMTNMKPKDGASIEASSLRGLQGRPATGLNGQAAKEEVSALSRGGWMPENISGVPAGRSVFHLTSPLIGLPAAYEFPALVLELVFFAGDSTQLRRIPVILAPDRVMRRTAQALGIVPTKKSAISS